MKHYLIIVLAILLPFLSQAQKRKCASQEHTAKLILQQGYSILDANKQHKEREISCDSLIIPLAFHFQNTTANRECLSTFIDQQVKILNNDFAGKNLDLVKYFDLASQYHDTKVGYSCIKFVVADKNHLSEFNLTDGMKAITINKLTEGTDWEFRWKDYLNIYIFQIGDNILGYSPLGGRGKGDGVAIAKFAFGGRGWCGDISQNNNFELGRTLTHEVGHFLGLKHIWGNNTGCEEDDGFADTPDADTPNFGCDRGRSCGSVDLSMNFMDYADDACMYMFTAQQVAYMEAYLKKFLPHFVDNAFQVITALAPPPVEVVIPDTIIIPTEDTTTQVVPTPETNELQALKPNWLLMLILYLIAIVSIIVIFKNRQ